MMKCLLLYLVNSAWQIPVIALCAVGLVRLLRKADPLLQHRIWVACLLLSILLPAFSSLRTRPGSIKPSPSSSIAPQIAGAAPRIEDAHRITIYFEEAGGATKGHTAMRLLPWLYLMSVTFGVLKLILTLLQTRRLVRTSVPVELPSALYSPFPESFARELGGRIVSTFTNAALSSPATVSWPNPRLLFPEGFVSTSTADAVAAIGHELAHVRRRDFYLNLAYEVVAVFAVYHPVLHWIKGRLDASREVVCDELAATTTTGRTAYARSLFRLAAAAHIRVPARGLSLGVFQTTTLEDRIMKLVGTQYTHSHKQRALHAILAVMGLIAASVCTSMFTLQPAFAQASEKPSAPDRERASYQDAAIAHGKTAKVTRSKGTYIHKWNGADGKLFVIASREQREPTEEERARIERTGGE